MDQGAFNTLAAAQAKLLTLASHPSVTVLHIAPQLVNNVDNWTGLPRLFFSYSRSTTGDEEGSSAPSSETVCVTKDTQKKKRGEKISLKNISGPAGRPKKELGKKKKGRSNNTLDGASAATTTAAVNGRVTESSDVAGGNRAWIEWTNTKVRFYSLLLYRYICVCVCCCLGRSVLLLFTRFPFRLSIQVK